MKHYSVTYFDAYGRSLKSFGVKARNIASAEAKVRGRLKPRGATKAEISDAFDTEFASISL